MKTPTISDLENPRNLLQVVRDIQSHLDKMGKNVESVRGETRDQIAKLQETIKPTLIDSIDQPATALTKLGVDQIATKKSNLSAVTDPGVGDDKNSGYDSGSFWFRVDGTPKGFVCIGANPGAADWRQIF